MNPCSVPWLRKKPAHHHHAHLAPGSLPSGWVDGAEAATKAATKAAADEAEKVVTEVADELEKELKPRQEAA